MGNAIQLRKIQNHIYNDPTVKAYTSKLCHDSAWQNVGALYQAIKNVDGIVDTSLSAGVYHNYINKERPNDPAYRDYKLKVKTDFGILSGYIRCHAAGTMDDEFSSYDMTISLYPDREATFEGKRVIVTKSQLTEIMDNQKVQVTFTGTNPNELGANAQKKVNDAQRNGVKPDAISLNGRTPTNNAPDNEETVIGIDTSKGNIKDAVNTATQNYINAGGDINKAVIDGSFGDIKNGTNESRSFTKRQIEEARLAEMRRTGIIMSKKELTKSFLI